MPNTNQNADVATASREPTLEELLEQIAELERKKEALLEEERKASSSYVRTPWCGNLDAVELKRPGGPLLAALISCANDNHLHVSEMANELGVQHGYINQLRNGLRPVRQVSDEFAHACARFLSLPRISVLILAGKLTPSDLFEGAEMMATEISSAMGFICNDINWGHLITPELRRADKVSQFGLVKLYEAATGKVLLDKGLDCGSVASKVAQLEALLVSRAGKAAEHSRKKSASSKQSRKVKPSEKSFVDSGGEE